MNDPQVEFGWLEPQRFPRLAQPAAPGVDLARWVGENRRRVEAELDEVGAVLFRGFSARDEAGFAAFARAVSPTLLDYTYRSTPRTAVGDGVHTATEYPAHATIPQHNENAYQRDWPMLLMFCAMKASTSGGETPLADTARVTSRIPAAIRDEFQRRGVMYVRNYRNELVAGLDLPWQEVFQTKERREVERYCDEHEIELEWKANGGLRTRQRCQAMAEHPKTGQLLWFNQAHLFHVSSLSEASRKALLGMFAPADLPRNAFYGDGAPIDEAALRIIAEAYHVERRMFPWRDGDVLLIDNMRVTHGRMPFKGARRILVAMAESYAARPR